MKKYFSFLIVIAMASLGVTAQTVMTLDEVIARARTSSVNAEVALNSLRASYWSYRSYRADLLPEVTFNATVPSIRKSYSAYQNSDGAYSFVRTSSLEMYGSIDVSQRIWLTGGTVSLSTSFDWLRQLGTGAYSRFMSVPIALTLNQPLFKANSVKWDRRMEPVRYLQAQANFLSSTEQVAMTAISYYFNLILARENVEIARQNLANAEKLHEVAIAKRRMGKVSENDVLQLELTELNARSALTSAISNLTNCSFQLSTFLGYAEDVEIEPVIPKRLPHIDLNFSDVYSKALERNSFAHSQRLSQLSADYSVASAKGNLRSVNLYAKVGFDGMGDTPLMAYSPLKDAETVQVGVTIPLLDWGKRRGQVKVAESNRRVTEAQLEQEANQFRQNLFVLVERFNNQQQQVEIAALSDTIAQKRYDTNVETFMIGRISTLDLSDSQTSKDSQRVNYINALFNYWYYYYQIRSITLWDFINNSGIDQDIERIIKNYKL